MRETVNLLSSGYVGSNPAPPINTTSLANSEAFFVYAGERKPTVRLSPGFEVTSFARNRRACPGIQLPP
jgi:hypothetical protein